MARLQQIHTSLKGLVRHFRLASTPVGSGLFTLVFSATGQFQQYASLEVAARRMLAMTTRLQSGQAIKAGELDDLERLVRNFHKKSFKNGNLKEKQLIQLAAELRGMAAIAKKSKEEEVEPVLPTPR